jgi:ATP-dependent Lon protease
MPQLRKKEIHSLRKKKQDSDTDSDSSDEDYNTSDALLDESSDVSDKTGYSTCSDEDSKDMSASEDDSSVEEKVSKKQLRKTLAKLFPSQYSKYRAKHTASSEELSEESSEYQKKKSKVKSKSKSKGKKSTEESESLPPSPKKRKIVVSSDEESDVNSESDFDTEDFDETSESKNYTFIMNFNNDGEEYVEEDDLIESDTNEEYNSEDEKTFMAETYEKVELPNTDENNGVDSKKKNKRDTSGKKEKRSSKGDAVSSPSKNGKPNASEDTEKNDMEDIELEYLDLVETKKFYLQRLKANPKNKHMQKMLEHCQHQIKKLVKRARTKNTKHYHRLVHKSSEPENEMQYFKKKLSNKDQLKIMKDLEEINKHMYIEKPYRLALLQSNINPKFKAIAMQKLNILRSMDPTDNEYYKIKNWVDTFMKIPFGIYRNLTIKQSDGVDVCDRFLTDAKSTLDRCVYGLNDAKLQIMQMLGQWIVNPSSVGSAIAIHGPPGTGKTSIVKDGISRILGREFAFIALGGGGDGSFLEGHSYTYEGSTWGRIVQILIESKSMNPVIYFDELDKVSDTARGQEIIGILTHLTDLTQNTQFHDKYFSEIEFDLSKCIFIFSYNDESLVNPILKDRMYRIKTAGYDTKEKIHIARDYLLPKIREQVNFTAEDVIIPDDTLQYIIGNSVLTKNESGVRNLKRCLEIIYTKLNLFRLVKPENSLFEKEMNAKIKFPMTITRRDVDLFIKNNEPLNPTLLAMYC